MYKIHHVNPIKDNLLLGTYLLLINPDKIPHLVLVQAGQYYSLTNKKVILGNLFKPYYAKLKRAKKKILFFEISPPISSDIHEVFSKYSSVNTVNTTCLVPIKETLAPGSNAQYIFELLPELYSTKRIVKAMHLNMENDISDLGDFNLNTYTLKDIFNYIEHLNQKHD